MMMRSGLLTRFVVVGAITAGVWLQMTPAGAQSGFTPILELHSLTTNRDGGIFQTATGRTDFVPGRRVTTSFGAGTTRPEELTLCGGGVGGDATVESMLKENSFVWKVTTVPIKYDAGRATFDLEWARYRADGGGRPAAQGRLTLTLADGQRQVIDLAHGAAGSAGCNAAATLIEVGVGLQAEPKLAQAILQYDLWLTHHAADGAKQVRHFAGMGVQGADVAFAFVPLRLAVPQLVSNQAAYDVNITVLGTLRGRLQADGRIALSVDTTRRDGLGRRGEGPDGWSGNSGVKRLELAPAEAVEIELPPIGGRSSRPAVAGVIPSTRPGATPQSGQPVTVADGRVTVDNARFFEGQRTSLVVQVRQVQ
jgi:hypothetical protein